MGDDVKPVPESALVPSPKPTNWLRVAAAALMFGGWAIAAFFAYRNGLPIPQPPALIVGETMQTGWRNDPEAVEVIRQGLPEPWFAGTPAGRAVQGNENETVLLSDLVKEFTGGHLPARNQLGVGSCVSFGTVAAIEPLFCVQAVEAKRAGRPPPTEFRELCQEVMYAGSRVEVGGGKIRGDGSVTAWAAQFARDWGVVPRDKYGSLDLTKYSEDRCREWGRTGVPADIEAVAKLSPVKGITFARSFAEVAKAIRNGYPIAIGSSVGFGPRGPYRRDADGFLTANGSWGHCVPYDTMISTQIPKPCQDVSVGDHVVAHDGKLHEVKNVYIRDYDDDMICLKADGMIETKFTKQHPVLVYRPLRAHGTKFAPGLAMEVYGGGKYTCLVDRYAAWDAGNPVWLASEEVLEGDYLLSPKLVAHEDVQMPAWAASAPQSRNVPAWPIAPTEDLAWLFGLYIADGNAEPGHRVSIVLNKTEAVSVERACKAWRSLGLSPRLIEKDTYTRVVVDSAVAANSFREWFGATSSEKHIPEFLYHGWDTRSLTEGITDGDGSVACKGNGFAITTTSHRLALQIHQLLLTNGDRPSMTNQPRNGGEYPNASPAWVVTWQPAGPNARMRHWGGYYLMPVREAKRERYTGKVWNYEVEGAHSYLSNNIVSHNCMAIIGVVAGKRPGAMFLNSWGPDWISGPMGGHDMPPGSFFVDGKTVDRMAREGDCVVFSDAVGFPPKALDWFAGNRPRNPNLVASKGR